MTIEYRNAWRSSAGSPAGEVMAASFHASAAVMEHVPGLLERGVAEVAVEVPGPLARVAHAGVAAEHGPQPVRRAVVAHRDHRGRLLLDPAGVAGDAARPGGLDVVDEPVAEELVDRQVPLVG